MIARCAECVSELASEDFVRLHHHKDGGHTPIRVKEELVELELAYRSFIDTDGHRSMALRTNEAAADIVISYLARYGGQARSNSAKGDKS